MPTTTHNLYNLYNPAATRTGHTHYVAYTITGNTAKVEVDDCVATAVHTMTVADARADYRRRLNNGYRAQAA